MSMDSAQIDLTLFGLDNMESLDFDTCDATLSTLCLPISNSNIELPSNPFHSASESAEMVLQASVGSVATFVPTSVKAETTASTASPTIAPIVEAPTSLSSFGTRPSSSTMRPPLTSQEQHYQPLGSTRPLDTIATNPLPERANISRVVASLSSEFQTIVRQVSLTSSDLLNADIHSLSGTLFPVPPSPFRAGHGPGGQSDPHGGFPPNSPTGLLCSQQHAQQFQMQQKQSIQQTLMLPQVQAQVQPHVQPQVQPQVQAQVQPQIQAQSRRNPQLHPLSIVRLQQQQQQQRDRANEESHHTDFCGRATANRPQQLRHPQLLPHQLPQGASHVICASLSSPSPALQPYPYSHPHPQLAPHQYPYPPSQVFSQPSSQMVQQQEFWNRQAAQYHHHYQQQQQLQQQQQQSRHLPPFPYPHPLADASFQSIDPNLALNATQYLPPLPPQQVFQSNQGHTQINYFGGDLTTSDNVHRDPQMVSSIQQQQQQQQQQLQATLLGSVASALSSPVSATSPPGFATPFHGHPYQYHNQCMVGPRVLISDPNSQTAISLGDQPHHPQFIPYEGPPATTGDEQQDGDSEVHTPASATQYVRTMKAEELAERLRHVREQKRKSSPPKPAPRQRQRRTQKQTQTQMQTPEEDLDHDMAPIKLCDSPLLAAQTRILQTLSKITAGDADGTPQSSGSQIPSPSTTPRSVITEGCLTTGDMTLLEPLHARSNSTGNESGCMGTHEPPGDFESGDDSRSTTEDSFTQENYEVQRVYHNLHVSLYDIEGTGRDRASSRSHDTYSSSSSSLGDESRAATPEPPKIKAKEGAISHASKTLPRVPSYSRGASYDDFSGPVRVRRPKRSLAELYENGRRRSLGYSDDPEKDYVDIEGVSETHLIQGKQLEKVEEYELEDTESGGEADDSSSDYNEKGLSPRRSRRHLQRRRASERADATVARARSGAATGNKKQNRRQNQHRAQEQSRRSFKTLQLQTIAMAGSGSDVSSKPQLHEEYTREMHTQMLRAQALVGGSFTPVGPSADNDVDVSPAGTSRDHASQIQSTDSQQSKNDDRNNNHCGGNGDIPCTFSSCPRTFTSQGLLKSHLVSHFEDKPFWCDECSEDGIHPRESLPPLMPGMPRQVFEVKRYKRNHDLLRHKREQHPPVSVQISRALEKIEARERRKEVSLQKSRERTEEKKKEEDDEEEDGQRRNPRKKGRKYEDESKDLLKKIEASARAIETLESSRRAKKQRQSVSQPKEEAIEEGICDGAAMKEEVPKAQRRARMSKKE